MNDRIHQYLDGELPFSKLSSEERREVEGYESLIREALPILREADPPDLSGPVMGRIGREAAPPAPSADHDRPTLPAWIRLLWEPRPVRLRPAYGLLAAAALLVAVVLPNGDGAPPEIASPGEQLPEVADAPEAVTVYVQFRLEAPDASDVRLAGSFTGWDPAYTLRETSPGVWSILVPLSPGVHDYAFVVDGDEWVPDPTAPRVDDGFGGENSRLALLLNNGRGDT